MEPVRVPVVRLPHSTGLPLPSYLTPGASGLDLCAAIDARLRLKPGERVLVPTGFQLALPPGMEAQVRPRSGLALRHGVTMLNTPGTIDSDFRGEVKVILVNLGDEPFTVERGDRIAQLVIAPVARARFTPARGLTPTARSSGGFGSTGV